MIDDLRVICHCNSLKDIERRSPSCRRIWMPRPSTDPPMRSPFRGRRATSATSSKFSRSASCNQHFIYIHFLLGGGELEFAILSILITTFNLIRAPEKDEEETASGKKKEVKCAAPESFQGCFQLAEGDDWVCSGMKTRSLWIVYMLKNMLCECLYVTRIGD